MSMEPGGEGAAYPAAGPEYDGDSAWRERYRAVQIEGHQAGSDMPSASTTRTSASSSKARAFPVTSFK